VHHPTEGKFGLPSWPTTAPSCLGAIKGTPRRMEEGTKHSLSILRLSHSASAHLIDCVSDLSSVRVVNSLCYVSSSSLGLCACVCSESSQDPPPELFEPLTMKKIPAPSREIKEEAASTPPAPPPSEELQESVQLEEEFDLVLPSQLPPEEVINISSLLTHLGDVSD
jgi:hypothetical protein